MKSGASTHWHSLMSEPRRPAPKGPIGLIDIGSSKLCCYIIRPQGQRGFSLIGRGYQLAEGLRTGEVVDADAAEASILSVVQEAEQDAGETLREISVVWGGGSPRTQFLRVDRKLDGRAIDDEDLAWALETARQRAYNRDRSMLHVLPVDVRLDGSRNLQDPKGLNGQSLEVVAGVVTVSSDPLHNLLSCIDRCHLEVVDIVTSPYAAGVSCITEDEIDRGCLVMDMGGGSTSYAHFSGGRLIMVGQVSYGGDHVTHDIAYGLSTNRTHAERIKNLYGSVQYRSCDDNMRIDVPVIGDQVDMPTGEVPRTRLTHIIRSRVEEIFCFVQNELNEAAEIFEAKPPRSMIVTGGAAQLEGVQEFAEELFGLPVRIGRSDMVQGRNGTEDQPCCTAASGGLALVAGSDGGLSWRQNTGAPSLSTGVARLGHWLRQNFVT